MSTTAAAGDLLRGGHPSPGAEFADAMGALASGVAVVTCRLGERPWGMTVTAFASVSADPPTVLVSLGRDAVSTHAIVDTRRFGVSILAAEQLVIACYCAARGATKFIDSITEAPDGRIGSPVVAGALAHLDCELLEQVRVADHVVFVGRVRTARASHGGTPLVYHRRRYRRVAEPIAAQAPTGRTLRCLSS